MLVEIFSTAAQLYEKSHLKRLELVTDLERHSRLRETADAIRQVIYHFLLVVYSNDDTVVHRFQDTVTCTVYVTACDTDKSFRVPPLNTIAT